MRRLLALLTAVVAAAACAPAAGAASLHRYAHGVVALAGGGHRVALADATSTSGVPTRVLDERTGREIAVVPDPADGCDPSALGAATVAFTCPDGPRLVSLADGRVGTVPGTSEDVVREIGSRWAWVHASRYHVDGDYIVDTATGAQRAIRDSVMNAPYELSLPGSQVIDLNAANGTRRLCRPIRRHAYRTPALDFRADDRGAVWSARGVWAQRCGHRPVRLSRYSAMGWVATRHTVAWTEGSTAIAVDRRTLRRRTWRMPGIHARLALTADRLWIGIDDRRGRPTVLTGRLPG